MIKLINGRWVVNLAMSICHGQIRQQEPVGMEVVQGDKEAERARVEAIVVFRARGRSQTMTEDKNKIF